MLKPTEQLNADDNNATISGTDPAASLAVLAARARARTATDKISCPVDDIVSFLDESKAEQIVKIDLKQISPFADYMIVANGRSPRHLRALGENLRQYLHIHGVASVRIEGLASTDWVLVDGGDVIIHLFRPEARELYNLEKLWSPAYRRAS